MNALFEQSSSSWVRYDRYELKKARDGQLYVTPAPDAKPQVYNLLKNSEQMVLDALNIGMLLMGRKPQNQIRQSVMDFISCYGLLGLMTALPTTPNFVNYKAVYLLKNGFIKEEGMLIEDYLMLFFPFDKPHLAVKGDAGWSLDVDKELFAVTMTFADGPLGMNISFQREYAERYDWILQQFKDWAFILTSSIFYYSGERISEATRNIMRTSMAAFDGIAPTYHLALYDKPTMVWNFHSLMLGIQIMFSLMLTDADKPLRLCKQCSKVFIAQSDAAEFCSSECKKKFDIYKIRKGIRKLRM